MAPKSFRVLIAGTREVLGKRFRFLGLGAPRAVLVLWVLLRTGSFFFCWWGVRVPNIFLLGSCSSYRMVHPAVLL